MVKLDLKKDNLMKYQRLKNKFDGANLDGLKAATGKNSDNYRVYIRRL